MRKAKTSDNFKVHAIAGAHVVMFGWHLPEAECNGLMGFSIHRVDETENEAYYLKAMKAFEATDPGFPAGALYSTSHHPIQSFQWADYSAKPGHSYIYTISVLKGTPQHLEVHDSIKFNITTESPTSGDHDVYFNRGIAASQIYERRFGDRRPEDVPNNMAFKWLSRGLMEALEDYINSCEGGKHGLRIAAYEFNFAPVLELVKAAHRRGVDVKIVYDARKAYPREHNEEAIAEFRMKSISTPRKESKSYISHNKFIIKLENDIPIAVWTGSTNFSEGGIYGHSNVAHVVEDQEVAQKFLDYWNVLEDDDKSKETKKQVEEISPLPNSIPKGTTVLFSPRKNLDALQWYADLAMSAKDGLFMTFAFGINDIFKEVYKNSEASFRLALMEKKTRSMGRGPARDAEEKKIDDLRRMKENTFAIGSFIRTNKIDGWVKERLTNLNSNVRYVHDKFMLLDPLSNHPIVVTGSANFSAASTNRNDENMLIIKGNKRVADIYLGEFMRLFSHHAFRESLSFYGAQPPKPLKTNDWWKSYFGNTARSMRRRFFAKVSEED